MNTKTDPSRKKVSIIAYGNPGRGDDAAGLTFLGRLQKHPDLYRGRLELCLYEDIQLNPEHIFHMENAHTVIFVDAHWTLAPGFTFTSVRPVSCPQFSTHSQSPENILSLFELTLGIPAPRAFLLAIGGRQFELGQPMSSETVSAVDGAVVFISALLKLPLSQWQEKRDRQKLQVKQTKSRRRA